jgi:MFS family permease
MTPRERAPASGIFNSGAGIGALVGPTAVGLLLIHVGRRPAFQIAELIGYVPEGFDPGLPQPI